MKKSLIILLLCSVAFTINAQNFIDSLEAVRVLSLPDYEDFKPTAVIYPPYPKEAPIYDTSQAMVMGMDPSGKLFANIDTIEIRDIKSTAAVSKELKNKQLSDYYFLKGSMKISLGDSKGAVKYFNKSIKKDDGNKFARMLRGNALTETDKYGKALKDYQHVIEIGEEEAAIHYNIGATKMKQGKYLEGVQSFTNAINLKSDYLLAYQGRASAYTVLKSYRNAVEDYEKVLAMNKLYVPAHMGRGVANSMMGDYESSIIDFNSAVTLNPKEALGYYYRGLALTKTNKMMKGCVDLSKAAGMGMEEAFEAMKKFCK